MSELPSQTPSPGSSEPTPVRKRRVHFWRGFWLTFLVVSLAYAWHSFYVPENDIAWADSYASGQQQAVESGKPMVLYFTGEWCVPCRVMKRQVWADEEVKKSIDQQFIPVAIDVDEPENADVLKRYKIGGAPVTIIVDAKGNALRWRAGGIGKSEFLELLREPNQ